MRKPITRWIAPLAILALALTACADGGPTEATDDLSIELKVVSGSEQTALAGEELDHPLVVKVERWRGWGRRKHKAPKAHHLVNFVVVEGGGSVFAGAAMTSWKGIAQDWWTLGPEPGLNRLEVRSVDPYTGEQKVWAKFTATGVCPAVSVTLDPDTKDLFANETVHLAATFDAGEGNTATGCRVSWTSSHPDIAEVDQDGLVTAGTELGTAIITATPIDGGTPGLAEINVLPAPVELVELSLAFINMPEGETAEVTATVTAGGVVVFDREVTWESINPGVATVDPLNGLTTTVLGVAAGGSTVTATSEGVSASVSVTITPGAAPHEPNDQIGPNAFDLGPIQEGGFIEILSNFPTAADPTDFFKVRAVDANLSCADTGGAGDTWELTITLSGLLPDRDYDLFLYDQNEGEINSSEDLVGRDELIVQPVVGSCDQDDSFDFFVEVKPYNFPNPQEPTSVLYTLRIQWDRL